MRYIVTFDSGQKEYTKIEVNAESILDIMYEAYIKYALKYPNRDPGKDFLKAEVIKGGETDGA